MNKQKSDEFIVTSNHKENNNEITEYPAPLVITTRHVSLLVQEEKTDAKTREEEESKSCESV